MEKRPGGKYLAVVRRKGKNHRAGLFSDPVEAARARDKLARKLQGPYAWLNLQEEDDRTCRAQRGGGNPPATPEHCGPDSRQPPTHGIIKMQRQA